MIPLDPSFDLQVPDHWAAGVILASPHSGRDYPDWFLDSTALAPEVLRSSEDAFVDRLIATAPAHGAAMIAARMPRCLVDLNRGPDEIDPLIVRGVPRYPLNQRTMAGLGVIPRVVTQGRAIHGAPMSRAEADRRIAAYWRPYHAALSALMAQARARFGQAILIDVHSMPRDALAHLAGLRPHVVLGNRHGLSSSARVMDAVAQAIEAQGWRVRRNSPFSGAYIAATYGRPAHKTHVVQVEIDRSLYMDESRIAPGAGFAEVADGMDRVIAMLARLDAVSGPRAIAAE